MRFVIVTGMSGAGKSTALKMLEDAEYFCVDNLPIPLVEKFAQLTADGTSGEIQKVAVGIDIRSGQALPDLQNVLEWMSINGICYEILFLDASDDVLVKRYKETRRTHPLAGLGRVDEGIRKERKALEFLKKDADYILDTSQLLTRELKAELDKIFVQDQKFKNLMITVLSFGFKYGIPADSDLVFDVRFLPNPYYVEGMRPLSGNDAPVRDYVSPTLNGCGPTTILVSAILTSGYRREESHFVAVSQRMVKTHQRLVDSSQQFAIFQRQSPAIALRSQMLA